jgi:hypothetical protein
MKKIGIITLSGNYNYGNRLQNYAMQEVYKKYNMEVETIWNSININDEPKLSLKRKIKNFIKPFFGRINYDKLVHQKYINFKKFTNNNIINSQYIIKDENNKILDEMYDYFSVGSDQVWNYTFGTLTSVEFLQFASKEKTISYAPSFGIYSIPENMKDFYKDGLNHIKHISVREDAGAKIIKDLTNRDAKVVLDPTMLLSEEEWMKVETKPKKMTKKKYIVTYFLDNISVDKKKSINELADKNNLEVINIGDFNQKQYFISGPSEFLYLFHNAELVLTDSFHACVFSVIYEKPFFVFDREGNMENMNSRLDTLLSLINLNERKIDNISNVKDVFACDYKDAKEKLKKEKIKSFNFIKESLELEEDN